MFRESMGKSKYIQERRFLLIFSFSFSIVTFNSEQLFPCVCLLCSQKLEGGSEARREKVQIDCVNLDLDIGHLEYSGYIVISK